MRYDAKIYLANRLAAHKRPVIRGIFPCRGGVLRCLPPVKNWPPRKGGPFSSLRQQEAD